MNDAEARNVADRSLRMVFALQGRHADWWFSFAGRETMQCLLETVAGIDDMMTMVDLPNAKPFAAGNGLHDDLRGDCRTVLMSKVERPTAQCVTVICGKCRTGPYSQPFSLKAERSIPGGAYQPPAA